MEAELGDAGRVSAETPTPAGGTLEGTAPDATSGPDRVILHVDLDAFFASVEQLRYPHLRGKPVIVGNGVIASCSYEARRRGCYAGQSLSDARRTCPGVVILDGCESVYRAFAEKTFALCSDLSPAMETFLDEAFIDLTGTERMHGDLLERACALKRQVREEVGLPITAGLGPNRMLAKIASKSVKPDGLRWIRAEEIESVLPALPIDRLPGVGYRIGKELAKLNVRTIGDLRAFPTEVLERMFGVAGRALHERCRGRDTRAVEAREVPQSISRETAFHEPVSDPRTVESMLYYLLERAVRHARGLGLSARTLAVWIDYMESGREAAARSLGAPSDQDAVFFGRARRMLAMLHTRREALRRIGVALTNFSADAGMQGDLFAAGADVRRDRLYRGLDAVRARFGHASVVAGPSVRLIGQLEQDRNGFVLRTPSLTK